MRSIWEGSISFGLINIPVKLYSATQEKKLSFSFLKRDDLCPIRYARICEKTGEEVPFENLVRGYKQESGKYVILEDEDFDKADTRRAHTIEVFQFTEENGVDSIFFEKPYYLAPTEEANEAYALFRDALVQSKKIGMAKFVMRNKEKLATVKVIGDIIILNQLRYFNEILKPEEINVPEQGISGKKELEMAMRLIDELSADFNPEKYYDSYTEELLRIIDEKSRGRTPEARGEIPQPTTNMKEIASKLKQSIEYARNK